MVKTAKVRKGVTIAETMVALALVSIMITLVISFVLSITRQTKANASNDAMRRDCILIESAAERWMNEVAKVYSKGDSIRYTQSADKTYNKSVTVKTEYALNFDNNTFVGKYPDKENKDIDFKIYTETVKEVHFELLYNDSELLLICTVKCVNPENEKTDSFIICVNPHVGDSY